MPLKDTASVLTLARRLVALPAWEWPRMCLVIAEVNGHWTFVGYRMRVGLVFSSVWRFGDDGLAAPGLDWPKYEAAWDSEREALVAMLEAAP